MWFLKLSLTMQHGITNPKAFLSLSLIRSYVEKREKLAPATTYFDLLETKQTSKVHL